MSSGQVISVIAEESRTDSAPSLLRVLSEEQQVRLTEILDEYLTQLEQGKAPKKDKLIAAYPELGDALRLYLEKLEDLHLMADVGPSIGCDLTGKQLGDYVLESEIGRGGMGIVFSAQQQSLQRRVAIKLLPMAAMLEPKYIERFRNEARAAAALQHPHIVPVHSIGEDAGIHYYAMRLIRGASLDERIEIHLESDTKPPTNSALLQFANVAEALHKAHQFGIVHRDIKPSNLLLDEDGKLWVADFGLARVQSENNSLTRTGEMVGTMRYMSPEQITGKAELVDHRTDIYSLGATLYELLSGQQAVLGEDGPALLKTISTQNPTRLRKLRPDLPKDLQTVVEKAMARHREDRYETAQDFADDLRRVVEGRPIDAKLVSAVVLAGRWAVRNPGFVSVAIGVFCTVGLGLSTATYMVNKIIRQERDQAVANLQKAMATERERAATIDRLAFMPGVEEVRKSLIPISLRYYKEFVAQNYRDPHLRLELGRAYTRMGVLSEEVGDSLMAFGYFEQADGIFENLSNDERLGESVRVHQLENANHLAMAMSNAGETDSALKFLGDRVEPSRTSNSNNQDFEVEYGLAENNYGLLLQRKDRLAEARRAFEIAIETLSNSKRSDTDNQKAIRGLGASLHNMGALLARSSNAASRAKAYEYFDRALDEQLAIAGASHNRLRASIDLVATYMSIGNLRLKENLPDQAVLAFDRAVQVSKKLVEISPKMDNYRRDLAVGLSNMGMACYQSGDSSEAANYLKESVHEYRNLLAKHPENQGLQSSLGITLNNQGIVLQHIGDADRAEEAYTRAANLLAGTKPLQTEALKKVYVNHVRMLRNAGRQLEADELHRRHQALFSPEKGEL